MLAHRSLSGGLLSPGGARGWHPRLRLRVLLVGSPQRPPCCHRSTRILSLRLLSEHGCEPGPGAGAASKPAGTSQPSVARARPSSEARDLTTPTSPAAALTARWPLRGRTPKCPHAHSPALRRPKLERDGAGHRTSLQRESQETFARYFQHSLFCVLRPHKYSRYV